MPTINIRGNQHAYEESDVITFAEGLIGLPQIRRAVVISINEFEPFCWLVPLEDERTRFVVVDPHVIFEGYAPGFYQQSAIGNLQTYSIVTIASDWTKTTINLRAPILIDRETKTGFQEILSDSPYHFAETFLQQ